ncbi:hypothetical protein [Lactiplantibacillus fabifermentans]|uniref:Uncharacterized protein n=2 Tax=Lactiplantibacillus fabifermentans TaxID=483011 RepID=A0A0R2P0J4_9LACO|nr:hypothetical protein [Lactiplantibacillus fabifermentans]ETY73677.1 hypothetical protein LFAB_11280 [Lactiplantibacillus fabifermentans T30PCM01]KRO29187.1 hypothetical protein DY78_GL001353 [Lactiplantibacillus fabifermentans DSM 21115]
MEIGPLSEWIAAFAEIIAVIVALFLPYVTARRERGKRLQRFKKIVSQSLNKAEQNQLNQDFDDFRAFIRISSLLETDETLLAVLQVGQEIVNVVGTSQTLTATQIADLKALETRLQTY